MQSQVIEGVVVLRLQAVLPPGVYIALLGVARGELIVLLDHGNIELVLVKLREVLVSLRWIIIVVFVSQLRFIQHKGLISGHGSPVRKLGRR